MRYALLLVVLVVLAGCASPPVEDRPDQAAFAFVSSRVDADGDGLYDHVNITLVAAPEPLTDDRVRFERDGESIQPVQRLPDGVWHPGTGLRFPCEPGFHEFRVVVDGGPKKVVVHECGVLAPTTPPGFEARVIDGDADGRTDAIQLQLLQGGPVEPQALEATMGNTTLRLYDSPLKSRVLRSPISQGQRVYTPCVPEAPVLNLTWQGNPLPPLRLTGCAVYQPGVDAPLFAEPVDVDRDGTQDGWNLTLGAPNDGPFNISNISAAWRVGNATINGSVDLAPPPDPWSAGESLVIPCPGPGRNELSLWVRGSLAFRVSETACESPPGRPLLEIEMSQRGGSLELMLRLSRVDPLNASRMRTDAGETLGGGTWAPGETREVPCPGGKLVLLYEERLAFRGEAPC